MKTPYEIAWNLMPKYATEVDLDSLSRDTGIPFEQVKLLRKKYLIVYRTKDFDIELLKTVIREIEQGKPHHVLHSIDQEQNVLLDLPVCVKDQETHQYVFNPILLEILKKIVRTNNLQVRTEHILMSFVQEEQNLHMKISDLLNVSSNRFARVPNCGPLTTSEIMRFLDYFRLKPLNGKENTQTPLGDSGGQQ